MDAVPVRKPRYLLVVAAVLSALAVGVLWQLQQVGQVCILIYPPPPGCGAEEPRWVPLVAIGLVIALLSTAVIAYFTSASPKILLIVVCGGILAVTAIGALVVVLSQTGIWDPYAPAVVID